MRNTKVTTHVTGEDVFDVIEEYIEEGVKQYKLRFKQGGRALPTDPAFNTKDSAVWEGDRWVRLNSNHRIVQDAFFEKEVLTSEDVSETGKTSSTSLEPTTNGTQSSNTMVKS